MPKFIDLTGQKFGRLTVLERTKNNKWGTAFWKCRCECGNETIVMGSHLKNKVTQSCGCGRVFDLAGMKFGRLTVLKRAENKKKQTCWLCRCECGNETIVMGSHLKDKTIQSCGCYNKERVIETHTIHGDSSTRLYKIWKGIKKRTVNPNECSYKNYGERGIKCCIEWVNSYENFKKWSLDNGYTDKLSIDRINVDGDYEPSNCRWATRKVQANNTRRNKYIEYAGKIQTLSEWCDELGLKYRTVVQRLGTLGWDTQKAFETPTR